MSVCKKKTNRSLNQQLNDIVKFKRNYIETLVLMVKTRIYQPYINVNTNLAATNSAQLCTCKGGYKFPI